MLRKYTFGGDDEIAFDDQNSVKDLITYALYF